MTDDQNQDPKVKMVIEPGAFDNFEGTQEELNELIENLTRMAESGELLELSEPLDLEEMFVEDPETAFKIAQKMGLLDDLVDEDGNEVTYDMIRDELAQERKRSLN